jgi:uncharacterized protein
MVDQADHRGVAVVTGASTGIGRALARQFVSHGFEVLIASDEPAIQEAADELIAVGGLVTAMQVDLGSPAGVDALHARARDLDGPVTAAALNAGIGVHGRFDETSLEADLALVDLNVRSIVHLTKLLVRDMVRNGEGKLLITASIAAAAPSPYQATYAASKAFLHSFAEAIGYELRGSGVSVTSLLPGPTDTAFFARAAMEDTKIGASTTKDDPDVVARAGFEAMQAGRASVVAGSFWNRLQMEAARHLPDRVRAAFAARQTKPGSARL